MYFHFVLGFFPAFYPKITEQRQENIAPRPEELHYIIVNLGGGIDPWHIGKPSNEKLDAK